MLILEYFLWRKGHEYAISNHYDRHCLWEEVAQNKKLNKYNHSIIDEQFAFYQADGMRRFNASDPGKLLPSSMISQSHLHKILIVFFAVYDTLILWQMYLKGLSLLGLTHQCQTCFPASGLTRSSDLLLVTS